MAIGNCGPYATGGADDGYGLGMERDEERSGSAARLAAATGNGRSAARQGQAPTTDQRPAVDKAETGKWR